MNSGELILHRVKIYLQEACATVEAGFYFEEGGCYGMALALFEFIKKAGLNPEYAYSKSAHHCYVKVEGRFYDYRGEAYNSNEAEVLSEEELTHIAAAGGRSGNDLIDDYLWAQQAINIALDTLY